MFWLGIAILGLCGALPVLFLSLKQKDYIPLIIGVIIAVLDFVWETIYILNGGWGYTESIFFIGVIPIELIIIFFSTGVIGVWMFRTIRTAPADFTSRVDVENIILALAGIFFLFHIFGTGVYYSGIGTLMALLGVYGLLISERKGWLMVIGLLAFLMDFILEVLLTEIGSAYWYSGGYSVDIAVLYMFGAWFIGGIITNLWVDFDWAKYAESKHKVWNIRAKKGYSLVLVNPKNLKVPRHDKGARGIWGVQQKFRSMHQFEPITINQVNEVVEGASTLLAYLSEMKEPDELIPAYVWAGNEKVLSIRRPLQ